MAMALEDFDPWDPGFTQTESLEGGAGAGEVPIKSPQVWPRHRASGKAHGRGSGGSGGGGGDGGGDNIFS